MSVPRVRERIHAAAGRVGRDPATVTLMAVTKGHSAAEIEADVLAHGVKDLGENRVQEWRDKRALLNDRVQWHFIGNLQRNKVKYLAAEGLAWVHSVNSIRLIETLEGQAERHGTMFNVMLEVNVANDPNKQGAQASELPALLDAAQATPRVNVRGLMTMAPFSDNSETSRPYFSALAELADRYGLEHRSMGMSNDFEVAVEEGATFVRVGSALFERDPDAAAAVPQTEGAS